VRSGSIYEPYGGLRCFVKRAGITHMAGHTMLKNSFVVSGCAMRATARRPIQRVSYIVCGNWLRRVFIVAIT